MIYLIHSTLSSTTTHLSLRTLQSNPFRTAFSLSTFYNGWLVFEPELMGAAPSSRQPHQEFKKVNAFSAIKPVRRSRSRKGDLEFNAFSGIGPASKSKKSNPEFNAFSGIEPADRSRKPNPEINAFSGIEPAAKVGSEIPNLRLYGIEPAGKSKKVYESSRLYDVFINHRGPDVKQTLAIQLYNSLKQLEIRAFLDSEEKELGNSFPSTIETAIRSAKVHIAIFSKKYAESAWCLAELVLMLQSNAKIIPVFYQVKPSDLRHIETGVYAEAFIKYKEKDRYLEKLNEWKEALQSLSLIAGEEFNSDRDCQKIVAAVQKEVQRKTCIHVADYPVGLNILVEDFERRCLDELVQDFENQCGLEEGKHKAKVVGIFGMGGVGKTTLAKELFNRKRSNYISASFLFDVREASARSELPSLQRKLLKDLFNEDPDFRSSEEGKSYLKDNLRRSPCSSFLIVVDDIDHVEQLNALAIMDILDRSCNSLVIVTTRDVSVLITRGITVYYNLKGMYRNDARELFCWHAFGQAHPCSGYEVLVQDFVDVCGGLPLSLQVLGRHVRGRDRTYWSLELRKVSETLPRDVKQRLRISFDSLDDEEKQVFMDIACFFLGKEKSIGERVWEGSGWNNAQHALETLKDKCLVTEEKSFWLGPVLTMHDHIRDLGREMALELRSPRRLWQPKDLKYLESMGFQNILAKTNVRCFHSIFDKSMGSRVTFFLGQSEICFETSACLLWLKLEGNSTEQPSIPSWIPLQNLQCLKIKGRRLKTLWTNHIQAPSQLKELLINGLDSGENFDLEFQAPSQLKELLIQGENFDLEFQAPELLINGLNSRENFVSNISISGIHFRSLESIKLHGMEGLMEVNLTRIKTLSSLDITNCKKLKRLTGTSDLTNLVLLKISQCPDLEFEYLCLRGMKCLEKITFDTSLKVKYFELDGCQNLRTINFDFGCVVELSIRGCPELKEMAAFIGRRSLERIILDGCGKLEYLQLIGCYNLKSVSCNFDTRWLYISDCPKLKEMPNLATLSCLEDIEIEHCEKIQNIMLPTTLISLSVQSCRELEELPNLATLRCLETIEIEHCEKIQNIMLPTTLISLSVQSCRELEELPNLATLRCLETIEIEHCEKIQNIMLPTTLISLSVQSCRDLQRVAVTGDLTKLTNLYINGCPELEELPNLATLRCLETIEIEHCEKIQNIMLPTTIICLSVQSCRDLQRVSGTGDPVELKELSECPELKELRSLSRGSCLGKIVIDSGEKLNIAGIEEVHEIMHIFYCNSAIRKYIPALKSVPSRLLVIGRAVDGAEACLNEYLFSDANIGVGAVIDVCTHETSLKWPRLGAAFIGCFVVVVDSLTLIEDINISLSVYGLKVSQGEWIITTVARDYSSYGYYILYISDVLRRYGILKKGFRVKVRKDEEWKSVGVLCTIVDRLYHL